MADMKKKDGTPFIIDGFQILESDGVPRIRDTDLARELGYEHARNIRRLIDRLVQDGKLAQVLKRSTVERMRNKHGERSVEVSEYWLNRTEALKVCLKSETPRADEVTDLVIAVFEKAIDAFVAGREAAAAEFQAFIAKILLPEPTTWEECFTPDLVSALCRLYDQPYEPGERHPKFLGSVNDKLYRMILPNGVVDEARVRNPNPRHGSNRHQQFTPDARKYVMHQLEFVQMLAEHSSSPAHFWEQMRFRYKGGKMQVSMLPFVPNGLRRLKPKKAG